MPPHQDVDALLLVRVTVRVDKVPLHSRHQLAYLAANTLLALLEDT